MWDDTSLPDYRMKKCLSITPQRKKLDCRQRRYGLTEDRFSHYS